MIDAETGGDLPQAEQVASTDLDTIINEAYDKVEAPEPPDPEAEPSSTERPRDERGRFASKTPPDAEASPEGATEATETAEAAPTEQPAPEQQLAPHPRWTEAEKATFAALPKEAQQFALSIQSMHEAAFTRKSQETAEFRKQAEPLVQAVQPYQQYLETLAPQIGMAPPDLIKQVLGFEYSLRTGQPHEKAAVLQDIAQSYGIDLRAIATGEAQPAPDPVIHQLRQTVATLQHELGQIKSSTLEEQNRQVSSQIDAFASATDANGQPKHPHFEVVKAHMGQMIANGQATTLEEAYALAAKPIEDRIASALQAKAQEAEKQRQEALEKAKRAAAPRSTGMSPNGSVGPGSSLDDILSQSIARAGIG